MTNSVDPDQLTSSEANWSGSTLFAKTGHVVLAREGLKTRPWWSYINHLSTMALDSFP